MIINKNLLDSFVKTSSVPDLNVLVRKVLADLNLKIDISGSVPANKPVLLIANHPGAIDSFIISSYVKRDDVYFVGIAKFLIFGPAVKKTLLPVFSKPKVDEKILNLILAKTINFKNTTVLVPEEMQKQNRDTISKAASLVNQGKMVSIFPAGSGGKSLEGMKWKAGVGFLAKQISNPNTVVVFANISGTRPTDYTIFANSILRKLFYKPRPIKITFAKPVLLSNIIDSNQDGKFITKSLEKHYNLIFN